MAGLEDMQKANLTATQSGTSSLNNVTSSLEGIAATAGINTGERAASGILFWHKEADPGVKLVGMNTDEASVRNITNGITSYTANIKSIIGKLQALENAGAGYGPQVGAKVQEFTVSMKEACQSVLSQLDRFAEDVKTVAESYRAKGESIISAVGSQASSISEAASSSKYEFEGGSN